ncbi:peptidase dimerization domain-containing protein, partial [Micrococcus sp. SIMBA_131]
PVPGLMQLLEALLETPFDEGTADFQPSNLEVTTVDVGNTATNVIPARATAVFNIRFIRSPERFRESEYPFDVFCIF